VIKNACAFLRICDEFGSFDEYIWRFAPKKPGRAPRSLKDVASRTVESDYMSKELKKRGFTFVGSTICYAFMQAVGIVNDHAANCFRRYGST
jgi:DNA-3-methyladenine glycosylase I